MRAQRGSAQQGKSARTERPQRGTVDLPAADNNAATRLMPCNDKMMLSIEWSKIFGFYGCCAADKPPDLERLL